LPLLARAAELSSAMRVGVYDCLYVALAEKKKCRFITADDKLIKNLQKDFPLIVSLDSI
jgi:predicted nucleic acid-binding protein